MKPKPGLKTSEFVVVIAVLAVTNVFAAISPSLAEKFPDNQMLQTLLPLISIGLAAIVNTLISLGWLIQRTALKKNGGNGTITTSGFGHTIMMILLAAMFLGMLSLGSGCSVSDEWIIADDLTYKAIAPNYLKYLEADKELDPIDKKANILTLTTWGKRIEECKKTNCLK